MGKVTALSGDWLLQLGAHYAGPTGSDPDSPPDPAPAVPVRDLTRQCLNHPDLQPYGLEPADIPLIALVWYRFIGDRCAQVDPLDVLRPLCRDSATALRELDRVVRLLRLKVFFCEKRILNPNTIVFPVPDHKPAPQYNKHSLLESTICLHRSFVRLLLGEQADLNHSRHQPYRSNREFLGDWFAYLEKLREFSWWDFSDRRTSGEMDSPPAGEYLVALEWKQRIAARTARTTRTFPLQDIVVEYQLDDHETTILMYLVKADIDGDNSVDMEEVTRLISMNQHEMYRHREYFSHAGRLVRNGLVEVAGNGFFTTQGGDIRVSPDITRRVIMRTPVNDRERLEQILRGNDIFTLREPRQTFRELILTADLKKSLAGVVNRCHHRVDRTLQQWGLFDRGRPVAGKDTPRDTGLLLLFHGPPGTGKTFAAGALANYLGRQLLVTDISRLQSKWVGESEKNVSRLFALYERLVRRIPNPPVLLLNEADQFLTRRLTSTGNSVDVMYNSLQNLFLEAFEHLPGILIATTNLVVNLDEAFSRRFHLKLEFPKPGYQERVALWKLHLPGTIPGTERIDVSSLARRYALTGGQIQVIVRNTATEAAGRRGQARRLTQPDLEKYCRLELESALESTRRRIGFLRGAA